MALTKQAFLKERPFSRPSSQFSLVADLSAPAAFVRDAADDDDDVDVPGNATSPPEGCGRAVSATSK